MSRWAGPWPDAEGARRASALFERLHGYIPAGVWAAPGRVNLIGEHVDYNGGPVLPIALPHRTYVALSPRTDRLVRLGSGREGRPWEGTLDDVRPADHPAGGVGSWAAYVVGVAWALERRGHTLPGFDAAVESCVPFGAGLSSSAALECAVAIALNEAAGLGEHRRDLAAACIRAENDIAGANTGGMDQHASLFARAGHALLFDTRSGEMSHIPIDLAARGGELVVIDTKAPHALVDGQYAARRATCETAARALGVGTLREVVDLDSALEHLGDAVTRRRVRHVVTEISRVSEFTRALDSGGGSLQRAGELLVDSHASLRDDYEVSCPELDLAVDAALGAGAFGARMTGGGFGGSAIALVPAGLSEEVAGAVRGAFTGAGFAAPEFLRCPPSGAAARVTADVEE